jgi:hypothetical protein
MENLTHWKKLNNYDYLGAYSLEPGKDMIATIDMVKKEVVTGTGGKKEECMVVTFKERDLKPMIFNRTNAKTVQKIYRTPYIEEWAGRKIQIYIEPNIRVGGETVEGLRVRDFIPSAGNTVDLSCTDCGDQIAAFGKKTAGDMAKYTYKKYGKPLCAECAQKAADAIVLAENPFDNPADEDDLGGESEDAASEKSTEPAESQAEKEDTEDEDNEDQN